METIFIKDDENNIILNIDNNKYFGYTFYHDGRIESIDESVINYFDMFKLSNDNKELPNEGKYKVILDNKTGFKHYYLDNKESYIMFFNNNGVDTIQCKVENDEILGDNGWQKKEILTKKEKMFKVGKRIIRLTCLGLITFSLAASILNTCIIIKNPERAKELRTVPIVEWVLGKKDYITSDLTKMIYRSEHLSDEDQLFLANEDFFNDILPYVNSSNFNKFLYSYRLDNIDIRLYDNTNRNSAGYYSSSDANVLYISEIGAITRYSDILSHEFIHMCQGYCYYNVITEACAEIFSNEYFDDSPENSYASEVYLIKKMMEIIGTEPILEYNFGDSFKGIEDAVKPYLTDLEYETFLYDLSRPNIDSPQYDQVVADEKHASLDYLLDLIYERKYGTSIKNDPVIPYLDDPYLTRYYFNKKKIAKEGSYTLIFKEPSKKLTIEEAMEDGLVSLFQLSMGKKKTYISYDEYKNGKYDTSRQIYFETLFNGSLEIKLEKDGNLYVYIRTDDDIEKKDLPTVEEKLKDLEVKTI